MQVPAIPRRSPVVPLILAGGGLVVVALVAIVGIRAMNARTAQDTTPASGGAVSAAAPAPAPPPSVEVKLPPVAPEPPSAVAQPAPAAASREVPKATEPVKSPVVAAPVAPSPPRTSAKPAHGAASAGPAAPKRDCDPNFYFDAQGEKHFKPECFR